MLNCSKLLVYGMRRVTIQTFMLDPSTLNLSSGVALGIFSILDVSIGVWGSNEMAQMTLSDICWFAGTTFEEIGERAFLREASCFSLH